MFETEVYFTLLLELAAAASIASILARWRAFQRMLMREERTFEERLRMAAVFGLIFGTGVTVRIVTGTYQAADLSLAGAVLAGALGGYLTGLTAGILISIPAMMHAEFMAMPYLAGVGVLGGLLRDVAYDTEQIWRFSPFFELVGIYRLLQREADRARITFQLLFLLAICFAEFLRQTSSQLFNPRVIFHPLIKVEDPGWPVLAATYATTLFTVALPLRVWNSLRTERKLEAQQRLLTETRLNALTYQINPHFLFNTLNSLSSLIRTNPDQARQVVYRLSNILRRLLRKTENMSTLGEELKFIDDYLLIEMVRFGDKLRFEKDVADGAMEFPVPSMLLQPLVENAIKHGLASKVEGGRIRIQAKWTGGNLQLAVEDDGVGIAEDKLGDLYTRGIGVSNINERLQVLYGDRYRMDVDSRVGEGTRFEIELPAARA
jgi:two-component system, LytTR family, sensor kinase